MASKLFPIVLLGLSISLASGFMGFGLDGKSKIFREPPVRDEINVDMKAIRTQWIEQKLDNFDPENTATWSMRYMENDAYFTPGGPMFIYVGGEWTISSGRITVGHIVDMARNTSGYLFYTEHRYYGQSHPTDDASTENLQYLNVDQALADLAHFIEYVRANYEGMENSQAIIIGGSYSATMVTWFRRQYPDLISGAWASSAPLLAKVDFYEYKEVVGEAMQHLGSNECYAAITDGFQEMEQLFDAGEFDTLREKFNLCSPLDINSDLDKWYFFDVISEAFSGVVQYNYGDDIKDACDMILQADNAIDGIATFAKYEFRPGCIPANYTEFIEFYSQTGWGTGATSGAGRQWLYQTCAEYGWYQSSTSENQPFGSYFPPDLYVQACAEIYGERFTPEYIQENVDRVNTLYGGMSPDVTNVFFTQGQHDPWRPMGIVEDYNDYSPAMVIANASHVTDLGSISASDSEDLRAVKERIYGLVRQWLGLEKTNSPVETAPKPIIDTDRDLAIDWF